VARALWFSLHKKVTCGGILFIKKPLSLNYLPQVG
jgi:hypothetical protein